MWKGFVSPVVGLWLVAGEPGNILGAENASVPVTYWQEDRCHDIDLGENARLRFCVEAIVVTEGSSLELRVSWRALGLSGKRIFKGSDADNHGMYLLDDLGNRYDHTATRGAARDGGRLDDGHPLLQGSFLFPCPPTNARSFAFRDDDQRVAIEKLGLTPASRTDPETSRARLGRLTDTETIRIDARSAEGSEPEEQYLLRRTPSGFHLESAKGGAENSDLVIPPPVMELFLRALSETPLLERAYEPKVSSFDDYPAITIDLRTADEKVFFFSRPKGERHLAWRAEADRRAYVVPDDSPLRYLEILDPFLQRDPATRGMRLLTPHLGAEPSAELWEKLEEPLGLEEALRVTRRFTELLAHGVDPGDVWRAADDYVAQVLPPGPSPSESVPIRSADITDEALFEAVQGTDADAVRELLSAGADADARGRDGKTALMLAAERGRTAVVQALLEFDAKPNVATLRGERALDLAARNQHRETVKTLLAGGADPRLANSAGTTALMEARDAATARILMRAGADVNASDQRGLTPIMRLISESSGGGPPGTPRRSASSSETADVLRSLLTAGADVRARDREGRTALIWAIKGTPSSRIYPEIVKMLIDAGSDLNARDREGGTPLVYAAVRGNKDCARLLIDAGADVNAHMGNLSALDIALRYGHSEIVTMLLRVGARR